jgi:putative hydrolase of the HAD superfamily
VRIDAVVFDLDDTLTDWDGAVAAALASMASGSQLSAGEVQAVREAMREFVCLWRDGRIVDRQHWRLVQSTEPWVAVAGPGRAGELLASFREALLPRLKMYDDFDAVKTLAGRERVAMLTNNPYARRALEEQGHLAVFETVVMAEEPFRKPHSQAFVTAASAFGSDGEDLVYVGDSIVNDVEGALAAGWTPIWIDRFEDGYDTPGASRISTLHELPAVLERLRAGA